MFLRTPYNYDRAAASLAAGMDTGTETEVVQSAKDDADINVIVRRFRVTGYLPTAAKLPTYGDFTGVSDYRTAMDAVRKAAEGFMELPASIRERFGNDPQQLLEFCSKPANQEELRKLGLAPKISKPIVGAKEEEHGGSEQSDKAAGNAPQKAGSVSAGDKGGAAGGASNGGSGAP